ncbi:hypothetical protein KRP22_011934 [Phytophthora ramorum]|nr:hypothetical protein KRP22_11772 [Phytophthora ramorum]
MCMSKRWSEVLAIYESTPTDMRAELNHAPLGSAIVAYAQNGPEEMKRTQDIFGEHNSNWGPFPCRSALLALLQTRQFAALPCEWQEVSWSHVAVYKMMVLAYLRRGSMEEAKQFPKEHVQHMQNDRVAYYRELIEHYVDEAAKLSLKIMQNSLSMTGSRSSSSPCSSLITRCTGSDYGGMVGSAPGASYAKGRGAGATL